MNEASAAELAKIFWELGGERDSRRMAAAIVQDREQRRFETTRQLAALIERLNPRRGQKTHPATQVFMALRLAVNDEISSLKRGLEAALKILKPGGRLAVITFHSLEDRRVKHAFAVKETWQVLTKKPVQATEEETNRNPRARSAKLRVAEKV